MNTQTRGLPWRLSGLVVALMAFASASGLLFPDLYRDNAIIASSWWGNDLVTLFLATPLFLGVLWASRTGSVRAQLVWMGLLAYSLYNGAFYLFGAAFNGLFLVYVAVFALSAFALVFGLSALPVRTLADRISTRLPARAIAVYMVGVGVLLGGFHGVTSLRFLATGDVPGMVTTLGLRTNLIGALDLSMVVSVALVGGVWLWRGSVWGYVLAVLWNVKGALYMTALSAATYSTVAFGPAQDMTQLILWVPIGVGSTAVSAVLLRHLDSVPDR